VNLLWTPEAWDEYLYWQDADGSIVERINALIKDIRRDPFKGIGKPEPLKGSRSGWWSRRVSEEHRLVYRVIGKGADRRLDIVQCRFHY